MNQHEQYLEMLPFYVNSSLPLQEQQDMARHLETCAACRAELHLWQETARLVTAQSSQVEAKQAALAGAMGTIRMKKRRVAPLKYSWQLLKSQLMVVHREIWLASALVTALGWIVAVISGHANVIGMLAPLVAAGGIAFIYGPENDPALEMMLAAPVSPRQVLLARLALVFSYNLVIWAAASLLCALFFPLGGMSNLTLAWLAPMTFLSMLALLLSQWIGGTNAALAAYVLWLSRPLGGELGLLAQVEGVQVVLRSYQEAWQNPAILLSLAAALLALCLWQVGRHDDKRVHIA